MFMDAPAGLKAGLYPTRETLDALFLKNFEIPYNQRGWAWGNSLLDRLWTNIYELTSLIYDEQKYWKLKFPIPEPHFIGTILIEDNNGSNLIQDGQQRITSVLLFLVCFYDELVEIKEQNRHDTVLVQEIDITLHAIRVKLLSGQTPKIKADTTISKFFEGFFIFPTSKGDRKLFLEANKGLLDGSKNLKKLHNDFSHVVVLLNDKLKNYSTPQDKSYFLTACFNALMHGFDCITVEIKSPNRVTAIFKCLNEGGVILNAADLIKNQLFHISAASYCPKILQHWHTLGKERTDFVEFFKLWYLAHNSFIKENQLFVKISSSYLNSPQGSLQSIQVLTDWIIDSARLAWIEGVQSKPPISDGLTITPIALKTITKSHNELDELGLSLIHIVTLAAYKKYFVGMTSLSMAERSKLYIQFLVYAISTAFRCITIGKLKTDKFSKALTQIAANIRATTANPSKLGTYWKDLWHPILQIEEASDSYFKNRLTVNRNYKNSRQTHYILSKLELSFGGNPILISQWNAAASNHIEHIMPQGPKTPTNPGWAHTQNYHQKLKGNLGNLVLLDNNLNVKIGKKAFVDKQSVGYKKCGLLLVKELDGITLAPFNGSGPIKKWNDALILNRAKYLASLAVIAWPLP